MGSVDLIDCIRCASSKWAGAECCWKCTVCGMENYYRSVGNKVNTQ